VTVGCVSSGRPRSWQCCDWCYGVLVVDRAKFPSDTLSRHILHPPGVAALQRWGLLDRLTSTGCPPIDTYAFDFGPFTLAGAPGTAERANPDGGALLEHHGKLRARRDAELRADLA
jgi:2-polyprenyl-6-methoxyphenol hydroxylase-like FAD-dependent oxidoreductase